MGEDGVLLPDRKPASCLASIAVAALLVLSVVLVVTLAGR